MYSKTDILGTAKECKALAVKNANESARSVVGNNAIICLSLSEVNGFYGLDNCKPTG